jgi:hypothetical protein
MGPLQVIGQGAAKKMWDGEKPEPTEKDGKTGHGRRTNFLKNANKNALFRPEKVGKNGGQRKSAGIFGVKNALFQGKTEIPISEPSQFCPPILPT